VEVIDEEVMVVEVEEMHSVIVVYESPIQDLLDG
jgi:hypothetical protein